MPVLSAALKRHADTPGPLLPILHEVQDALGYVPSAVVPQIAHALNLSRAEVHGVLSYYHHFRHAPLGHVHVQVCRAEACQAMGGEELLAHARETLGCREHDDHDGAIARSADGRWSVQPVYCLGLCASSPAALIGERPYARLTPQRLDAIVQQQVRT
jgi:formate dehydrogenase subunit gamma